MNSNPTFSIVVPLYNEEGCVQRSVKEILNALELRFKDRFELILVINGSTDGTEKICARLVQQFPQIKITKAEKNLGYGGGILKGLSIAEGDFCGYTCGDGQAPPSILVDIINAVIQDGGSDLVKATRIRRRDGILRDLQSWIYNGAFRLLFQLPFRDINAMPKMMRKEIFQRLNLESTDWFIDAEIMIKTHHAGLKIKEVPAEYLERIGGTSAVHLSTVYEFLKNTYQIFRSGKIKSWKQSGLAAEAPKTSLETNVRAAAP